MKIIHLSDLHFGTERPDIVEVLLDDLQQQKGDVYVISGDFTQRATYEQYQAAQAFIKKLNSKKVICVPGNHDIALYNIIERFFYPFKKYNNYLTPEYYPAYADEHIVILGINSATPYKAMSGYVSDEQLAHITNFFNQYPNDMVKVIVMHHNLIASERHKNINHAEKIIETFALCKVNLILSGHLHCAYIEQLKRSHINYNMYVITAGTAISTRTTELNSYNIIEIGNNEFKLTVREYEVDKFKIRSIQDIIL